MLAGSWRVYLPSLQSAHAHVYGERESTSSTASAVAYIAHVLARRGPRSAYGGPTSAANYGGNYRRRDRRPLSPGPVDCAAAANVHVVRSAAHTESEA